mmetsp:Transcript_6851/g.9587  ORF Transcript_6851/g.9587 Transcript_6851/m.9587 type:complete len:246 (+) Transcript_6851:16-753(+)
MITYDDWVDDLHERHGIGEGFGLVTPNEARRHWESFTTEESISEEERNELDAIVDENIGKAVAFQALIRGRKSRCSNKERVATRNFRVLAPYNPTPDSAIAIALSFLNLQENDILYDIGCGDGRFVISAAKDAPKKTKIIGIEADAKLATRAEQAALSIPNVQILQADATCIDFTDATKIFLYLVPCGLSAIKSTLDKVRHSADVVSYTFTIPEWIPDIRRVPAPNRAAIYFYPRSTFSKKEIKQ